MTIIKYNYKNLYKQCEILVNLAKQLNHFKDTYVSYL